MTYFKGLDTLRAFAAIVVVIEHTQMLGKRYGVPRLDELYGLQLPSAHLAVVLFFVLSGFLITYLLVRERERTGGISFRKFYARRIFRIWPLYYLIIALSFLAMPDSYRPLTWVLSLSIFPNVAHALECAWSGSPQIWSIGVEEQFYLFWPVFIAMFIRWRLDRVMLAFIAAYTLLPHAIGFVWVRTVNDPDALAVIYRFFYGTKFNCMALGGLLGYLHAKNSTTLDVLKSRFISYPVFLLALWLWMSGFEMKHFTDEFFALLFGIVILNVATGPTFKWNLDRSFLNPLGKVSFGIYMFHWVIIDLLLRLSPIPTLENPDLQVSFLYCVGLLLTILVSWVSYHTFEKYFLKIKERYSAH